MAIGTVVGHSSRSFPVHREKVLIFDIVEINEALVALGSTSWLRLCQDTPY